MAKFVISPYTYLFHEVSMAYVKKTIEIDAQAIKKTKKIFDVSTDKEAVNLALKFICDEDEIIRTHESLAGQLQLQDLFR